MSLHIKDDHSLTREDREAFYAHLMVCSVCREEHEQDKQLIALVKEYWGPISEGARKLLEKSGCPIAEQEKAASLRTRPMTVAESWEDLKRRSPSLAAACRRQEAHATRRRFFWRAVTVAAAASILIAVGSGWIVFQDRGDDQSTDHSIVATQSQDRIPAGAFAELITSSGRQMLALDRPVKAGDQQREVILGGKHRVVMNTDTIATFGAVSPQPEDQSTHDGVAYEIQLAKGELYVEVAPGHPFTVKTDNALLTITGTKFGVLAEPGRTELTLVKGSVRFSRIETHDQGVDVIAGHASSIVGQFGPSNPQEVDALAATAWARDLAISNAIAQMGLDDGFLDSVRDNLHQPSPPDLDSIDYDTWLENHRDWFAHEFQWIFKAKKVLQEHHGVDADYVELLMISGDIWQFNHPQPPWRPIPVFNPAGIERIAKHYKVARRQLLEAARAYSFKPLTINPQPQAADPDEPSPANAYLMALMDWQFAIASADERADEALSSDLLLFSLRAGTYLANTRTAAYLWIQEYPDKAEALLAGRQYRSGYLPAFGAENLASPADLAEYLRQQVADAHKTALTAEGLLVGPARWAAGCELYSDPAWTTLRAYSSQPRTKTTRKGSSVND